MMDKRKLDGALYEFIVKQHNYKILKLAVD